VAIPVIIGSGPQMNAMSTLATSIQSLEEGGAFLLRHAAGEQLDLLRVLFEHVDHVEPPEIAVLQILELLAEHDRGHAAVGVDQREADFGSRARTDLIRIDSTGVMPDPPAKAR
jgi:hypothetical protein